MADNRMREMVNTLCDSLKNSNEYRVRESKNSVTLYIKPTDSTMDYKVIIMEHKPKGKNC